MRIIILMKIAFHLARRRLYLLNRRDANFSSLIRRPF